MSVASLLIKISADARDVKGGVDVATREMEKLQNQVTGLGSKLGNLFPPSMSTSIKEVGGAVGSLVGAFGGLGGVVAALGIGAAAQDFLDTTGALSDLSAQTDITTRDLQRFQYAGDLVGVSLDNIVGAVGQLQNRLGSGDKGAFAALDRIGVSFQELQRLDPGQQFETIASAISKVQDPSERAAIAMDLFGRTGVQLMPLLRSNLKEVGDQARVLSDQTVAAGDAFGDTMTRMSNAAKFVIGEKVFGPIVRWADDTTRALTGLGQAFDILRGKAEQLPDIGKKLAFTAPVPTAKSMGFDEAMRLSDELTRKVEQSIEQRKRLELEANAQLERSALSLVSRVDANADAHFRNELAVRRLTLGLRENIEANTRLIPLVDNLTDSWLAAGDAADAFNSQVRIGLDSAPGFSIDPKVLAGEFGKAGKASGKTFGVEFGREITQAIVGAVQGGGNVGASIGAAVGGSILGSIGKSMAENGGKLLGAIGGALGPLGAIGGQLVGGLVDKFFGSAGRDRVKEFLNSFEGGAAGLRNKLVPLGAEGERLWVNLTQGTGKNNPQQAQANIDAVTAALGRMNAEGNKLTPSFLDAKGAAEALGLDINAIGDGIHDLRVTDMANEMAAQFKVLEDAGADMDQVARGSAERFQVLVDESLKWGHALPESIRPILDRMKDMGLLTDDAGEKLTDLDKLNWDTPVKDSVDDLKDAFRDLAAVIRDEVGGALSGIRTPSVNPGGGGSSSSAASAAADAFLPRGNGSTLRPAVNVYVDGDVVENAMDTRYTRYNRVAAA